MTKFNFKLEKVLNYKETVENLKKNRFGSVQQKLNKEESLLDDFNKYKVLISDEKKSTINSIKAGDLVMYNTYINDLNTKIAKQQEVVLETKKELEKVKEEMIDAVKEKKIFEKLKENKFEEYTYDLKKQDEKLNDSIVSYKATAQN